MWQKESKYISTFDYSTPQFWKVLILCLATHLKKIWYCLRTGWYRWQFSKDGGASRNRLRLSRIQWRGIPTIVIQSCNSAPKASAPCCLWWISQTKGCKWLDSDVVSFRLIDWSGRYLEVPVPIVSQRIAAGSLTRSNRTLRNLCKITKTAT